MKQPEVSTGFGACQWTIITKPSRKSLSHVVQKFRRHLSSCVVRRKPNAVEGPHASLRPHERLNLFATNKQPKRLTGYITGKRKNLLRSSDRRLNRHRIGENPQSPPTPASQSRLPKVSFCAIVPGTEYGKLQRMTFLLCDFTPVLQNADHRMIRTCWHGYMELFALHPCDRITGPGSLRC